MTKNIIDIERIEASENQKLLVSFKSENQIIEADYIEFDHNNGKILLFTYN